MPVFISYSHKDKEFVSKLAINLIRDKTWVWLDEWEIAAGESLIERIQTAIEGASILIAVFSKAAVESIWCKREVTAGIQRELEEKRVVVVPAVIEGCELPLFLRDKKFADFRSDFDAGLQAVRTAVAKFTNPSLGRIEKDEYHADWSLDWGFHDNRVVLRATIVKHSIHLPYSALVQITVIGSAEATTRYHAYEEGGFEEVGQLAIAESILAGLEGHEFFVLLEDVHAKHNNMEIYDPNIGVGYFIHMESRRLGTDTGQDILMHGKDEIQRVLDMARGRVRPLTPQQQKKLAEIVRSNMERTGTNT
jgi:TIR domain